MNENEFSTLPDLSEFVYLNTLDLTNAYNLKSLDSLGNLNIKELILDECNSIKVEDDGSSYMNALSKLSNLDKLSTISGLNYMTEDLYSKLTSKVKSGEFKLRFINDDYIDSNTIYNYSQSIYFTMNNFLTKAITIKDEKRIISAKTEEVILSLVNDRTTTAKEQYTFYVPSSISKISIYGNEYDTYNIAFDILDRKQSSITFDFSSFKDVYNDEHSFIKSCEGARVNINTYNNCEFSSNNKVATIDAYDIVIEAKSGMLNINGSDGEDGEKNIE